MATAMATVKSMAMAGVAAAVVVVVVVVVVAKEMTNANSWGGGK